MSTYEDNLLAARFAALAPEPPTGDWGDVLGKAGLARQRRPRRRLLVALTVVALAAAVGAALAVPAVRELFLVGPFAEGRVSRTVEGVRFLLSVPRTGWENGRHEKIGTRSLLISKSLGVAGQHAQAVVFGRVSATAPRPPRAPSCWVRSSTVPRLRSRQPWRARQGRSSSGGRRESPSADTRHSTWCSGFARTAIAIPGTSSPGETHGGVRSGPGRVWATPSGCGSSVLAGRGCSRSRDRETCVWCTPGSQGRVHEGRAGDRGHHPVDPLRLADVTPLRATGLVGNPTPVVGHERGVECFRREEP